MSYTAETEDSIAELDHYDTQKRYVVVASTEALSNSCVVFEPNYRFSKVTCVHLLSSAYEEDYSPNILLYKINLPCPFNPFIYIFFDNLGIDGVQMMGNPKKDSRVFIANPLSNKSIRTFSPEYILTKEELNDVNYAMTNSGDIYINDSYERENDFCLRKYQSWTTNQYMPFYYYDDKDPTAQVKLVYKNEESEFSVTEGCCQYVSNSLPHHTIYEFTNSMINYFLSLFHTSGEDSEVVEMVRTIYGEYFQNLKPAEVFDTIGLLIALIGGQMENVKLDEHYIVITKSTTGEKRIYKKTDPNESPFCSVQFYPSIIKIYWNREILITYKPVKFQYEFILPPKCVGCESID